MHRAEIEKRLPTYLLVLALLCGLSACGGGGEARAPAPDAGGISLAQRSQAASSTAASHAACTAVQPFYWEIGNAQGVLASGRAGGDSYDAASRMHIASASKWLYAAYVAQTRAGQLSAADIKALHFQSGYADFSSCLPGQTVAACATMADNGLYRASVDGLFHYGGGHMQQHALNLGLGALDNAGLAAELRSQLGSEIGLSFSQPQPAGGVVSTAADYARFLRKLLKGELQLGALLGSQAVCTNPNYCAQASYSPSPANEQWHYSLGHWVEDDPTVGDGAFSSPGAFGFYPWIAADKTHYGILARRDGVGSGFDSVRCGRLIRKAWFAGAAV